MTIGSVLKVIRISKNLSHRDLDSLSGVSFATISQIETGKIKSVGIDTLSKLSTALGMKAWQLVKIAEEAKGGVSEI